MTRTTPCTPHHTFMSNGRCFECGASEPANSSDKEIRLYSPRGALIAQLNPRLFKVFKCAICGEHAFQEIKTANTYHVTDENSDHIAREL